MPHARRSFLLFFLSLATALILAPPTRAAGAAAFTLEQVMSAPFPTEIVAAPVGGGVAWVFDERGARNVWVAEPPDYKARRLTDYTEDDGQEILDVRWTPDGRTLVYTRGGDANAQGEYPNPTSNPAGVEQAVWVLALAGGAPRRLGTGHSPAISPRGDQVAFIYKEQAWAAPLDGSAEARQFFHARGQIGSLRWSPDGTLLAFVSNRDDHSFVGVYDAAAATVRYLDPSTDLDSEPVWSPDGRQVAFLRIPSSDWMFTFGPHRTGPPWSIRVADAASGKGREVWRAGEGRGSVFREVVAENQLLWGADNRIVFPWEEDGWTHLYSVAVAGGAARLLTPGAFEVEYVTLSPDRQQVFYSSNQDDIDRRHLWRVPVDAGAPPAAVTSGTGIEWSPEVTSDGAVAFLASDARMPAHPAILLNGAPRALAPETLPADFPLQALVEPQQVILSAADGLRIHGQLFLPADLKPGEKRPAVVFFHGGSQREMLLGWHYMEYYHNAYAMNQYLASLGYVVLSVNYRSGIGYGMEFREAENYGAHGASEFNDVLGAGLYLRSRADVDPERIGLWGGSYGGYLTALGLARASDLFAAGVDLHGVHDWNVVIKNFAPHYDPLKQKAAARLAFASSPLAAIDTWRSPVLLIQGDDDSNVPFNQTVDLAAALRAHHVEYEELIFPDEIHDLLRHQSWLRAYAAAADFFARHLRSPAP